MGVFFSLWPNHGLHNRFINSSLLVLLFVLFHFYKTAKVWNIFRYAKKVQQGRNRIGKLAKGKRAKQLLYLLFFCADFLCIIICKHTRISDDGHIFHELTTFSCKTKIWHSSITFHCVAPVKLRYYRVNDLQTDFLLVTKYSFWLHYLFYKNILLITINLQTRMACIHCSFLLPKVPLTLYSYVMNIYVIEIWKHFTLTASTVWDKFYKLHIS